MISTRQTVTSGQSHTPVMTGMGGRPGAAAVIGAEVKVMTGTEVKEMTGAEVAALTGATEEAVTGAVGGVVTGATRQKVTGDTQRAAERRTSQTMSLLHHTHWMWVCMISLFVYSFIKQFLFS